MQTTLTEMPDSCKVVVEVTMKKWTQETGQHGVAVLSATDFKSYLTDVAKLAYEIGKQERK